MGRLMRNGVLFAVCVIASTAVAYGGHYDGPMDVNAHSVGRVNDGSGAYFSIHDLEAPHTVQGYVPPRSELHRRPGGRPHSSPPPRHGGSSPYYDYGHPYGYGAPPPPPPPPYYGAPPLVSRDGSFSLPPPPVPGMSRDEYQHWLRQVVPNYNDLPLGEVLRMTWDATGAWDNPKNNPRRGRR